MAPVAGPALRAATEIALACRSRMDRTPRVAAPARAHAAVRRRRCRLPPTESAYHCGRTTRRGIWTWPYRACGLLADDGDLSLLIVRRQETPAHERNPHGLEITGADPQMIGNGLFSNRLRVAVGIRESTADRPRAAACRKYGHVDVRRVLERGQQRIDEPLPRSSIGVARTGQHQVGNETDVVEMRGQHQHVAKAGEQETAESSSSVVSATSPPTATPAPLPQICCRSWCADPSASYRPGRRARTPCRE